MARRRRSRLPAEPVTTVVESLSHDGRGVARIDDKAVFIHGALPGETVVFRYTGRHRHHDEGCVIEVIEASGDRVDPRCEGFGVCGGCSLQHLEPARQIEAKQQVLLDNLVRIGKVEPETLLPPLTGPVWGYRRKARLGVRFVRKKNRVLVGFRERHSAFIADIGRCEVLHPAVGEHLADLASLIGGLDAKERIAQIEVAVTDDVTALVFRNLDPLSGSDRRKMIAFAQSSGMALFLQPGGPDSVEPLWPERIELFYRLPAQDIEYGFSPTDFTQINDVINQRMVARALEMLDPQAGDRVLDLFCGLGNFTLPLARHAAHVTGVEGDRALIDRARDNAAANHIDNCDFHVADLFEPVAGLAWTRQAYDRILLDPPRSGAQALVEDIDRFGADRILYVSCHPGSLARDAGILTSRHGYRLLSAGVMDMFPHTAHVESIALFER